MLQQCQRTNAIMLAVVSWPAWLVRDHPVHRRAVSRLSWVGGDEVGHQSTDQVAAHSRSFPATSRTYVNMALMATTRSSRRLDLESRPVVLFLEELVIPVRHAEQQRSPVTAPAMRNRGQVGRRALRDHLVDVAVDQLLNLRPHRPLA